MPPNSIVYCDPPYRNTTEYFNEFDSDAFWEWAREISGAGQKVFVSEYTAPADFKRVWEKEVKSSLSANGKSGDSKTSVERLFVFDG